MPDQNALLLHSINATGLLILGFYLQYGMPAIDYSQWGEALVYFGAGAKILIWAGHFARLIASRCDTPEKTP